MKNCLQGTFLLLWAVFEPKIIKKLKIFKLFLPKWVMTLNFGIFFVLIYSEGIVKQKYIFISHCRTYSNNICYALHSKAHYGFESFDFPKISNIMLIYSCLERLWLIKAQQWILSMMYLIGLAIVIYVFVILQTTIQMSHMKWGG